MSTILLCTLIATSTALYSVLLLWAVTLQRHWFLRAAVIGAGLSMLLLIPAYELFVAHGIHAAIIAAVYGGRQLVVRPKNDLLAIDVNSESEKAVRTRLASHFSLQNLMLVFIFISGIVAVGTNLPNLQGIAWCIVVCLGIQAAIQTLIAAWIVAANSHVKWRLIVGLLAPLATMSFVVAFLNAVARWGDYFLYPPRPFGDDVAQLLEMNGSAPYLGVVTPWEWRAATIAIGIGTVGLAAISLWLLRACAARSVRGFVDSGTSEKGRLLSALTCVWFLGMVAGPVWSYGQLFLPPPHPKVTLPKPNAYDTFLDASQLVPSSIADDPDNAPLESLRKEVLANQRVMELVELGLTQQCLQPLGYTDDDVNTNEFMWLRDLGRAVRNAGQVAMSDADYAKALNYYLNTVQLGSSVGHGGLMIHGLIGTAIESSGLGGIHRILPELSLVDRSRAIAVLERVDREMESADQFIQRDIIWSSHAYGWQGRFESLIHRFDPSPPDNNYSSFIFSSRLLQSRRRLLILELAIRSHQSISGIPPDQLSELVPDHLDLLPLDPFGNGSFVYRRTADKYVLYSVGPDGVDDGGKMVTIADYSLNSGPGDFSLDSLLGAL